MVGTKNMVGTKKSKDYCVKKQYNYRMGDKNGKSKVVDSLIARIVNQNISGHDSNILNEIFILAAEIQDENLYLVVINALNEGRDAVKQTSFSVVQS